MISIYRKNKRRLLLLISIGIFFVTGAISAAGLSLSVTPTLFEMSAVPGQSWQSSVKVINNNKHPLTVYASVVNFEPKGENGHGKFIPVFEEFSEGKTLAEWITVSDEAYVIPPETSKAIPLTINVPDDASPGGHFAAIMIGTKPIKGDTSVHVQTAQVVSSLFFLRVAGDVIEKGDIRSFKAKDLVVDTPEVDFELRFENKGNVHLQPQGEIIITNMWGKERGIIPINKQTHFGNVLPNSIRKFDFSWKGERSFSDIGRYTASVTLAYGIEQRQFVSAKTHFWIIPIKALLSILAAIFLILFIISWSIKAYIRRMLYVSGIQGYTPSSQRVLQSKSDIVLKKVKPSVTAPVKNALFDLRKRLYSVQEIGEKIKVFLNFISVYRKFFIALILLTLSLLLVWYFISEVTKGQKDYEVTIKNSDTPITVSSEEIIYKKSSEKNTSEKIASSSVIKNQNYDLVLINASDIVGAAADLQIKLEQEAYQIAALKSDFGKAKKRTVIVFDKSLQEAALELSSLLNNALLSAKTDSEIDSEAEETPNITVYIGNDYRK